MKSNFVNLLTLQKNLKSLSGNYNYGFFCGWKDTSLKACDFLYDLLSELNVTEEEKKDILKRFREHIEL